MVNKAEVQLLIDAINAPGNPLKMGLWVTHHGCGTAYCLGGWAAHLSGWTDKEIDGEDDHPKSIFDAAAHILGLRDEAAWRLFFIGKFSYPDSPDHRREFDQLEMGERKAIATRVLEELRDTGDFSWRKHWEAVAPLSVPDGLAV